MKSFLIKVFFGLALVIFMFVLGLIIQECFTGINEKIVEGEGYDFTIGSSKGTVFETIKIMNSNGVIDYSEMGFSFRKVDYSKAGEISKYFDGWSVFINGEKYRLLFGKNGLIEANLEKTVLKNGLQKSEALNYLEAFKSEKGVLKFSFFYMIVFDTGLISLTSDYWDIGYLSNYGVDYLSLRFEDDRLVEIYRKRHFLELP